MKLHLQSLLITTLILLLAAPTTTGALFGQDDQSAITNEPISAKESREPWSEEIIDTVSQWPIQHGGRVKPFQTFAGFLMLKANGRRSLQLENEKLGPVAWALDFMYYPEIAKQYRCIHVPNAEVLTGIGFDTTDFRRSDRYSFSQLEPVLPALFESARKTTQAKPEAKEWTLVERQTIQLMQDIRELEVLIYSMDSARYSFGLNTIDELIAIFGENPGPGYSPILAHIDEMAELTDRDNLMALSEERRPIVIEALRSLQEDLIRSLEISSMGYSWFPPEEVVVTEENLPVVWTTSSEVIQEALVMKETVQRAEALRSLEQLPYLINDRAEFLVQATIFGTTLRNLAAIHDSGKHLSTEVAFYNMDYFLKALVIFLLGFIVSCLGWLVPQSKTPKKITWAMSLVGVGLLITGVTIRCIIQGRPPVTTLYETILFITGCCVLTALVLEYYDRRNIALTVSTFLGALGCFLSNRYELKEAVTAGDTMPSLVAVLDTNFWLSTHVTTVTLGYAAGLLAAAISHVWIFSKLFGVKKSDPGYYKSLTRMVYGTICFGLFFSIVGTILGGIWANYSWGRFWGWDPKENGALMICLAELIILHLRMGGYIRDRGVHILSVGNAMIIAFSWWGVNLLGVGLHSYGFTDGVFKLLAGFFALELIVMGIGLFQVGGGGDTKPPSPPPESPLPSS
ncbi:MAG: hypothetical protein CBC13_03435 [Planctomycetia bacterium TMED53]|nr:MAG: hypothetical protein CBC13_03435 [Planctomycetia bacterium TMED53]